MSRIVVHCKKESYDTYVGRGSRWGNPYSHKPNTKALYIVPTLAEAVERFHDYLLGSPDLYQEVGELRGQVLGCWCAPPGGLDAALPPDAVCHAQILAYYAN